MANKKINASDVNIPSISLVQQAVDPATLATRLQLYAYNNLLRLMRTDGTVQTMVDLTTTQTLANKTLTSPTLNDPILDGTVILSDTGGTNHFLRQNTLGGTVSSSVIALSQICQGRLTLTSGTPITTSNVSAAGTLYWTPFRGNGISLYESSVWTVYEFSEVLLALTLTNALPYDVFAYSSGGSVAIETTAWTNTTTRATGITLQNGVYVKSGATERRYLGSILASNTNQVDDSTAKRYLWNYYNRVERPMSVIESTDSWNHSGGNRYVNNNSANKFEFIVGVSEDAVSASALLSVNFVGAVGGAARTLIGLDSSTSQASDAQCVLGGVPSGYASLVAQYKGYPGIGYHYLAWLENGGGVNYTFYGDAGAPTSIQSGMKGYIYA